MIAKDWLGVIVSMMGFVIWNLVLLAHSQKLDIYELDVIDTEGIKCDFPWNWPLKMCKSFRSALIFVTSSTLCVRRWSSFLSLRHWIVTFTGGHSTVILCSMRWIQCSMSQLISKKSIPYQFENIYGNSIVSSLCYRLKERNNTYL